MTVSQRKYKGTFVPHFWEVPGIVLPGANPSTSQRDTDLLEELLIRGSYIV